MNNIRQTFEFLLKEDVGNQTGSISSNELKKKSWVIPYQIGDVVYNSDQKPIGVVFDVDENNKEVYFVTFDERIERIDDLCDRFSGIGWTKKDKIKWLIPNEEQMKKIFSISEKVNEVIDSLGGEQRVNPSFDTDDEDEISDMIYAYQSYTYSQPDFGKRIKISTVYRYNTSTSRANRFKSSLIYYVNLQKNGTKEEGDWSFSEHIPTRIIGVKKIVMNESVGHDLENVSKETLKSDSIRKTLSVKMLNKKIFSLVKKLGKKNEDYSSCFDLYVNQPFYTSYFGQREIKYIRGYFYEDDEPTSYVVLDSKKGQQGVLRMGRKNIMTGEGSFYTSDLKYKKDISKKDIKEILLEVLRILKNMQENK